MNPSIILFGKLFSQISQLFNFGNGSTWPGHIALKLNRNFIQDILKNSQTKIILIAGTNGKTTTSLLLKTILEENGQKVIHNSSGANLLNGLASALLLNSNAAGKITADYAIFEVDENTLPIVLKEIDPQYVVLLNLFRDQLDRYGEVASVAAKWTQSLLHEETIRLILNADDPQVAFIGQQLFNHKNVKYFGLNEKGRKEFEHAVDSIYCPRCGNKLSYSAIYYSHLGDWHCEKCELKRPQLALDEINFTPLSGLYNKYNTLAAILTAKELEIPENTIESALKKFKPAFGRQEVVEYNGKKIQILLTKNPAGFNQTLQTIKSLGAKNIIIALNDGIADGTDVSWIWDIDTEMLNDFARNITVTGDRAYDMGLRLKYSTSSLKIENCKLKIEPNLNIAIDTALQAVSQSETLYILPTYTAMLDIRKILGGKKIL
ncbi:MAG TPA: Mur ligase family protein [Patescibacteria group bacterium]|nr:Mur ligase family protein [Patescibacteria group bacterium]